MRFAINETFFFYLINETKLKKANFYELKRQFLFLSFMNDYFKNKKKIFMF